MFTGTYIYDKDVPISGSFSVYPSLLPLSEASCRLDIPAPETQTGATFSVRAGAGNAYSWYQPTSKHFAEIFITVTAHFKCAVRAVKKFIRQMVRSFTMTMLTRRPACLRL